MASSGTDPCHLYYGCFRKIYLERNPDTGTGKIEVPVLDATAIGVSMLRGDYGTAGSVMFLLGVESCLRNGRIKKSVGDLARSMSLNVGKGMAEKRRPGNSRSV